jgi:hypothetical protein
MVPTKVRKATEERNRRNELIAKEACFIWGLRPQAPGIYRFDANPK